jgi:hypothetical protein
LEIDPGQILNSLGNARRFADPNAPIEARMMAAGGALPLPPPQVAQVLFALTLDPEAEVKERARATLESLPDAVVDAVVEARVHPGLLGLMAELHQRNEARLEKLSLNPATSNETLCFMAALPLPAVIDSIAHNQTRLLECDDLLSVLGENPLTGPATIGRILEFLARERGEIPGAPSAAEQAPEELELPEEPDLPEDPMALEAPDDLPPELVDEGEAASSPEEEEERGRSLQSLIQDMTVVEKIKLARFGNGEARNLLVRDRNRIVATAAIRSPKLTENEVAGYAKSRQICDEVLRIIASSREWTRSYPIKHGLATNPKTPVASAIKFVNYLTDRDLKTIMKSRDVPAPVSQQARRILARKGKT